MTEIDMDAYNSSEDKIKPGKHEEFDFHPSIHSFGADTPTNWYTPQMGTAFDKRFRGTGDFGKPTGADTFDQRFMGEPSNLPTNEVDYEKGPTGPMPTWWPKQVEPQEFPNRNPYDVGPKILPYSPENDPNDTPEQNREYQKHGGFTPVSDKEPPKMFPDIIPMAKDMKQRSRESLGFVAPGRKPMDVTPKELFNMLDKGMTHAEIAKEVGVQPQSISNKLKNTGLNNLSAEDMRNLREFYKNFSEGGPTEPELIDSAKKYLTDTGTSQMRNPANTNTELHPSQAKDPYRMIQDEDAANRAWDRLRHIQEINGWLNDVKGKPNEEFLLRQRLRQTKADNKMSGTKSEVDIGSIQERLDALKKP